MAKVIQNETKIVIEPWWVKARIVFIGLGLGLFWWIMTSLLHNYVVEPLACRDIANAATCVNSFGVSGNIATILTAVLGAIVLIRGFWPRPVIVAVAAAISLWDLGFFLTGTTWWVTLFWGLVIYGLAYTLFWCIARIRIVWTSLIVAGLAVLAVRLSLAFL